MENIWLPFVSYNLWLQFWPAVGQEQWHCDMKRGFSRVRKKEIDVKALLEQDNTPQQIGLIAQKAVYEFHKYPLIFAQPDAVQQIAKILSLNQESVEVQDRVMAILNSYYKNPILYGKNIIQLNRGDERYPKPILIRQGDYDFNLYAAIDCVLLEPDDTIHILDFKTGKTNFDRRQAFVYLLAAKYLYPEKPAIALFYNLETGQKSDPISATEVQLKALQIELMGIAQQHQEQLSRYRQNPDMFNKIFPPNPGAACRHCPVSSMCKFAESEIVI